MKTTITLNAEEVDVMRGVLYIRADVFESLSSLSEDEQRELELAKRLLRRIESAARRIEKKRRRHMVAHLPAP